MRERRHSVASRAPLSRVPSRHDPDPGNKHGDGGDPQQAGRLERAEKIAQLA
jgi:hypothetical protein